MPFERRLWGTPPDGGLSLELVVCRRRRDLVCHRRRAVAVVSILYQASMANKAHSSRRAGVDDLVQGAIHC